MANQSIESNMRMSHLKKMIKFHILNHVLRFFIEGNTNWVLIYRVGQWNDISDDKTKKYWNLTTSLLTAFQYFQYIDFISV